ncbi:mitochondrial import inner membrane translocase subunit Tim23 [Culicoides brevitarsis]|uniref:mitochondrial import inner membrane translocase subunit Tim23 n=1 Tax=Culicoides brevitarsis TaxID=469753 RepID=UPI00307C234E
MSEDFLNKPLSFDSPSSSVPSPTAPTKSKGSLAPALSPYLNYDPRYLNNISQPEFIFPEGASKQRGRFELAFAQIGSSVMIGAAIGGAAGLYNGVRATALAGQTGQIRRTQLLNHVMKQGSATANTLGTLTVMYSAFGVLFSWARGEDDEINTVLAGTATGLLYKSTSGLRRCLVGGGVGLALTSAYVLWNLGSSSTKITDLRNQYL